MAEGRILGLDYGTRRIGVAISDGLGMTAHPHSVLTAADPASLEELVRICVEYEVTRVVVGLPVSLDGSEGASAAGARLLATEVEVRTGLPVEMMDERFTTKTAEEVLIKGKVKRRDRKQVVDKVAAAVMLQQYLDRAS